jgi:hypothetical protein
MGRHGSRHRRALRLGRVTIPLTVLALCALLLAVTGLGVWWWTQRSVTDPIDAAPVSATATVVSSPSCLDDGQTTVRVSGVEQSVESVLDGCGFSPGQRISVEYAAGHPEVVRLAGTTRAGHGSTTGTIVSIVILVAGLAAAAGLVALSRAGARRPRAGTVSVAELRARMDAARSDRRSSTGTGGTESGGTADGAGDTR